LAEAYFTRFCMPINTLLPNCQVASRLSSIL
jgi:hypothetical protein